MPRIFDGDAVLIQCNDGDLITRRQEDGDAVLIQCNDGDPITRRQEDGEAVIVQQVHIEGEYYDGPTTVTPTREIQVLNTMGKTVTQNITVEPIPPNYGLITWDGRKITVS